MADPRLVVVASGKVRAETRKLADAEAAFRERLGVGLAGSYRLAAVILGNPNDAEDATQDALEHAWRSRRELREPERFDAWFQRILVNACIDRVRRRRSGPLVMTITPTHDQPETPIADSSDPFAVTAERDALIRALDQLSVEQRAVIALRFYLDLEIEEIARRLGTPTGTVKSRLHRGLKELRNAWESVK